MDSRTLVESSGSPAAALSPEEGWSPPQTAAVEEHAAPLQEPDGFGSDVDMGEGPEGIEEGKAGEKEVSFDDPPLPESAPAVPPQAYYQEEARSYLYNAAAAASADAGVGEVAAGMIREELSGTASAVGIDLGTTYSCVSVWKDGKVEIIPDQYGSRVMPSYVAFTNEQRLVGEEAYNQVSSLISRTSSPSPSSVRPTSCLSQPLFCITPWCHNNVTRQSRRKSQEG